MEEEIIATAPDGLRELSAYTLYVDIKKSRFTRGDLQTHIDVQAYRYYNVPLPDRLKEVEEMLTQQGTPYTIRP